MNTEGERKKFILLQTTPKEEKKNYRTIKYFKRRANDEKFIGFRTTKKAKKIFFFYPQKIKAELVNYAKMKI